MSTITIGQVTLELGQLKGYNNCYIVKESPYPDSLNNEINHWLYDGCWDLFSGYENETYYQELVAFQHEAERMFSRASDLGCRGNLLLVAHIEGMETEIHQMREMIEDHLYKWSGCPHEKGLC